MMSPEKTIKFLKLLGAKVPASQTRGGWIISSCPLGSWQHEHGKSNAGAFGVKKEQGDPLSTCFSCGWHGSLRDLTMYMSYLNKRDHRVDVAFKEANALIDVAESEAELNLDVPDIEEMLFGEKESLCVFPDWWLSSFAPVAGVGWAEDYLAQRAVSPAMALALDLRADLSQKRICFPVRGFTGQLFGLHGRAVNEADPIRYRMYRYAKRNNPIVWYGEHWIDRTRPIVVVEGPFDAASVLRVYDNVTSPLFVNPSLDKIKRMSDGLEWITLYDRGKGGDTGRAKVSKALHRDHVVRHLEPPKGRKDPGVMTVPELTEVLSPYVQLIANNACFAASSQ